MSSFASPIHALVLSKFRAAFGEPTNLGEKGNHWSLRALKYVAAVNILVNGDAKHPIVWVFNPHDPSNGVSNTPIQHESQIEPLVESIVATVAGAARPPKH